MARPLKYQDPIKLQDRIDEYFERCDNRTRNEIVRTKDGVELVPVPWPIPYTIEGLAVWLDTNRQTLLNYSQKDAFFDVISRAKERIQANKVEGGLDGTYNPKMAEFMLKNNYGYMDKKEDDEEKDNTITINVVRKDG